MPTLGGPDAGAEPGADGGGVLTEPGHSNGRSPRQPRKLRRHTEGSCTKNEQQAKFITTAAARFGIELNPEESQAFAANPSMLKEVIAQARPTKPGERNGFRRARTATTITG